MFGKYQFFPAMADKIIATEACIAVPVNDVIYCGNLKYVIFSFGLYRNEKRMEGRRTSTRQKLCPS
jgi:hypothetical protein